jgi:hypothetical protein
VPGDDHRNQIDGTVVGPVVQARDIGEVHIHPAAATVAPPRPGRPLHEATDPFAYEVHRAIQTDVTADLPALPAYVARDHDARLGEAVAQVLDGVSRIVVLVGGSSTGKTRACWEALAPLRSGQDWTLWHPIHPTRAEAALAELPRIEPRTVVWLNEIQFYLADPELGERVASGVRELLRDPHRGPVLVLGTVWPGHWATLTAPSADGAGDPNDQARKLLAGHDLPVPETFGAALDAAGDPRLRHAAERAEEGQVIQYLAGAPALVERYRNAPVAARALITAAMDARRLGHSAELPRDLLADAAEGYLTDAQLNLLDDDWLDGALSYATAPVRGVGGPLTRLRTRRGQPQPAQPRYRLADYLDQHGRAARRLTPSPPALWDALVDHGAPADRAKLAQAAYLRSLWHVAARFGGDAKALGTKYFNEYWIEVYATSYRSVQESIVSVAPSLSEQARASMVAKFRDRAEAGKEFEAWIVARMHQENGRVAEALDWYRRAAEEEDITALPSAVWMLRALGRTDESARLHQYGWEPDGSIAQPWGR